MVIKFIKIFKSRLAVTVTVAMFFVLLSMVSNYSLFLVSDFAKKYISEDMVHMYLPDINFLLSNFSFKSLHIPHWNFFASSGSPNLLQVGNYYLPNYLLKVIRGHDLISINIYQLFYLVHLALAGFSTYLYLRWRKLSITLSIFGGMLFMFCGWSANPWVTVTQATALVPLSMLFYEKYLCQKKSIFLFLCAFVIFQQFSTFPQGAIYALIFLLPWGYAISVKKGDSSQNLFFPWIKLVFWTGLYSAIILLPSLEFSQLMVRSHFVNSDYLKFWSLRYDDIFGVLFFSRNAYEHLWDYLYFGPIIIFFITRSIITRDKYSFWYLLLSVSMILFALVDSFSQVLITQLPILNNLRFYSRIIQFLYLPTIFLVCSSIQNFVFKKRDYAIIKMIYLILGFLAIVFLVSTTGQSGIFDDFSATILIFSIFVVMLFGFVNHYLTQKTFVILVSLILVFDLFRVYNVNFNYHLASYSLDQFGEINKCQWPLFSCIKINGDKNSPRMSNLDWKKFSANSNYISRDFSLISYNNSGIDISGASIYRYKIYLEMAEKNHALYRLAAAPIDGQPLPRAFTLNLYKVLDNDQEIYQQMTNPDFSGSDYIILEKSPVMLLHGNGMASSSNVNAVKIENESNDIIIFSKIETNVPTLLFISDNWYPGWNAYVDGKKTELLRADFTFKAIEVPAGSHSIIMKFEPKSLKYGGLISWLAIFVSLIYLIYCLIKRKKC